MYCSNCGKEVLSGNNVCEHCGEGFENQDTTETNNMNGGYVEADYTSSPVNSSETNQGNESNQSNDGQEFNNYENNQSNDGQEFNNYENNQSNDGQEFNNYEKDQANDGQQLGNYGNNQGSGQEQFNNYQNNQDQAKSKVVAGLLGLLVGSLGIHNFYLGYTNKGLIQILVTLIAAVPTCGIAPAAMGIWGFIEGIQILTGTINVDANGVPLRD